MTAVIILREQIREYLDKVPGLSPVYSEDRLGVHVDKLYRYTHSYGRGFALDREVARWVKLWVRRDTVRLEHFKDIESKEFTPTGDPKRTGRSSNIDKIHGFKGETVACFKPKSPEEAERIIAEVLR